MAARDYDAAPVSDRLNLDTIISGLAGDLEELRAGKISVSDAVARSMLAKQIFNGVRLYLNGTKILSDNARMVSRLDDLGASVGDDAERPEQTR